MKRMLLTVLAACTAHTGGASGGDDGFHVFYPDARTTGFTVKLRARMQAKPAATCRYDNGRDAKWANTGARVTDGELPPGLALEDGAIAGAPTKPGHWHVTVTFTGVTCAGQPQPDQRVELPIAVE